MTRTVDFARTFSRAAFACAAFALTALPAISRADADSDALLARLGEKLHNSRALSAAFTISTLHPTRYADTQERGTVTLARPDKTRIEITRYRKPVDTDRWIASGNGSLVIADGKNVSTLITHPGNGQHRTVAATPAATANLLSSLAPLQAFFGDVVPAGAQTRWLGLKTWENASYSVVEETFTEGAKESARGSAANSDAAPSVRELYIGADNLIHRAVTHSQVKGKAVQTEIVLHDVRLDPSVSDAAFVFTPPADAVPFEKTAPQALLAAGTDAPDFQAEDAAGKTVRLSDLRGKVVVLKFFATWCWTCRQSLPDTDALAQKYKEKDVLVLAVDIWNSRAAFAAWAAKTPYHAIRFAHDDRPQGKDAATLLYHVSATPAEYVIGKDGKIIASSTGYEGHDTTLEHAIETALARPQASASR